MDALCEFIEFWLGPRRESYGEPAVAATGHPLPMPLRRLYEFAGRWPHRDRPGPIGYAVPAFSRQDHLFAFDAIREREDGKIVFVGENQGVWQCSTLPKGDDPPVWCDGDQFDGDDIFSGERIVCDSLSRFLTTFVLQELAFGSQLCLWDESLSAQFASVRDEAIPVWTGGPYLAGIVRDYHLWGDVLVGKHWGDLLFAANHDPGIGFLARNQGPINEIDLSLYRFWRLSIRPDGSASLRYLSFKTREEAEAPAGTFDFPTLLATLSAAVSGVGHFERIAMVTIHRRGQSGGVQARHLPDGPLATLLFRRALERATEPNPALERLFADEWPL